jgi:hypothetical protein
MSDKDLDLYLYKNEEVYAYEGREDAKEGWIRIWYIDINCKCNLCSNKPITRGHLSWMPESLWKANTIKLGQKDER